MFIYVYKIMFSLFFCGCIMYMYRLIWWVGSVILDVVRSKTDEPSRFPNRSTDPEVQCNGTHGEGRPPKTQDMSLPRKMYTTGPAELFGFASFSETYIPIFTIFGIRIENNFIQISIYENFYKSFFNPSYHGLHFFYIKKSQKSKNCARSILRPVLESSYLKL